MCDMLHDAKFCDVLHDARRVTYNMQQNVWFVTSHKMRDMFHNAKWVMCYMTQNVWYVRRYMMHNVLHVTWRKMCDMLHAKKMWHVICNKDCDVLHATKTINNTPTNQTLNEYIHPDITGCLSSYSWIFIHLSQLIQWTN